MVSWASFSAIVRSRLANSSVCVLRRDVKRVCEVSVPSFARPAVLTDAWRVSRWKRSGSFCFRPRFRSSFILTRDENNTDNNDTRKTDAGESNGCGETNPNETMAKGNLFLKLSSKVLIYVKANVIAERIRDLSVPCKYLPRELHGMSRKNWHTDVRYLARRNNRTLTHA